MSGPGCGLSGPVRTSIRDLPVPAFDHGLADNALEPLVNNQELSSLLFGYTLTLISRAIKDGVLASAVQSWF